MRLRLLGIVALALAGKGACAGQLLLPAGVAYDAGGNLFVADTGKNQVLEVSLAGVTTVVAGNGVQGFGGDGGAATVALLDGPVSVAVGADGTIYIADTGNQRIRAVAGGVIQTVAGNGAKGFSGDGGDARLATLRTPLALATDSGGAVLIADSGNQPVRRLSPGVLTTFAGTGVQGFSGDGGAAALAEMDTPAGVAVASDGRIFIADSHNHRIRVVTPDGRIATFAGSGVRGFGGDGGAASAATLFLPRGVAVTAAGEVVFADSDNQRLRVVNSQGTISTVAGNGVQGSSAEGAVGTAAPLDSPRGVAVSSFAAPVFVDAHNRAVREVASNAALYALPGGASHVVTVTLAGSALTYGQGTLGATVSESAPIAQGNVSLLDGGTVVSTATLGGATAVLAADSLSAGPHMLTAAFGGDVLHGAALSAVVAVNVAARPVVATAQGVSIAYGTDIPALTGTLMGVLPRDAAMVNANFVSSAQGLAAVGTYPIAASLSGPASGNYMLTLGASSGSLQIVQAASVVAIGTPQTAYAGLPVTLSASVGATGRGTPTGIVNFSDAGAVVGSATIAGGTATVVYLSPSAGSHSITAAYAGDHNFLASNSAVEAINVSALPDFSLAVTGSGTQTVQGGSIATYAMQVGAQPAPFSGSVSLSASGLPTGATVSFSPTAVVPGNGSAAVTMSVQTVALVMRTPRTDVRWAGLLILALPWLRRRRAGGAGSAGDGGFLARRLRGQELFGLTGSPGAIVSDHSDGDGYEPGGGGSDAHCVCDLDRAVMWQRAAATAPCASMVEANIQQIRAACSRNFPTIKRIYGTHTSSGETLSAGRDCQRRRRQFRFVL